MSVEAITWALKQSIKPSSLKFVLVAMANCADGREFVAWPSTEYLADATGQDRKTVLKNVGLLRDMGYLIDTGERKGHTKQVHVYRLNSPEIGTIKQYQERNSSKNGTVPNLDEKSTVFPGKQSQISLETVPKTGHGTVKEPSKNRHGNRQYAIQIPAWLSAETWSRWDEYRKRKGRSGWTEDAIALSLRKLSELRASGFDPVKVIEQSIECGWTGLFEVKAGKRQSRGDANIQGFLDSFGTNDPMVIDMETGR